jgi:dTDP-4-dehydrorhamnose 3,5-epimerase
MTFRERTIEGVGVVEPEGHEGEQGFFARTWDTREFTRRGLNPRPAQCSVSYNLWRGTLRGMHHRASPHEEAKLVRCASSSILDVAVDLRTESAGFRRWVTIELRAENRLAKYRPEGCAHGFLALTGGSEVAYQIFEFHAPDDAGGVRWNDPAIGLDWPADVPVINERDGSYPDLPAGATS